jgi:hypothetical protein
MTVNDNCFIRQLSLLAVICYMFWLSSLISHHEKQVTNIYEKKTTTVLNKRGIAIIILQLSIKGFPYF